MYLQTTNMLSVRKLHDVAENWVLRGFAKSRPAVRGPRPTLRPAAQRPTAHSTARGPLYSPRPEAQFFWSAVYDRFINVISYTLLQYCKVCSHANTA